MSYYLFLFLNAVPKNNPAHITTSITTAISETVRLEKLGNKGVVGETLAEPFTKESTVIPKLYPKCAKITANIHLERHRKTIRTTPLMKAGIIRSGF